ncbi:DUF2634 domain-containing protein [Paenibacillus graminis]|uniref:contractile injection system sheath initiator n=1 Tax=Paenibacillus graminis TaxID=189425 RepID=UPI002DBBD4B3|nr:DUF2634 domain-containing protein [Paenibacillus graminis]MEC0169923.1 hypothetical protein [Paenibacillus graminis]
MIEHILSDADTIQGLAVMYNVPWQTIADDNRLEYPYTMTSSEAYKQLHAAGYLLARREFTSSPLTVYARSTFATEPDSEGVQKIYELVEDTTLAAGAAEGYFYVRCTQPGSFGNTIAGSVIVAREIRSSLSDVQLKVINPAPFSSGKDTRVRLTGQAIFINMGTQVAAPRISYVDQLGGSDLKTTPDGDLIEDGFGDWEVVSGLENIQQAVSHRLVTRRGSLTQHPTYGSRLHELIGQPQLPYIRRLVELDIQESLLYEERIEEVVISDVVIRNTIVDVSLVITVAGSQERVTLSLNTAGPA